MEEVNNADVEVTLIDVEEVETDVVEEIKGSNEVLRMTTLSLEQAAFPDSSKELHDEIILQGGTSLDTNNDGIISIGEAGAWGNVSLSVANKNLSGTMDGIEYFTNLKYLYASGNNFSGLIPAGIGNISGLIQLQLQNNQLTGSIPAELGQLQSLTNLNLTNNQLSGSIPAELANLSSLDNLALGNNNLSGEISTEIYGMNSLLYLELHNNIELTGNPAKDITSSSNLVYINVAGTEIIQAQPDLSSIINFVYDDLAADLLNADGSLKDGVTQEDIDNAEDLVNKLPDCELKDELEDKLKEAQKQLDERNFTVLKGFKTFTGTGTVYTTINAPVEKFNAVYVDGKLLPSSNYVVISGSTVITLNEAYLKTLANGIYNVEIEFISGARISSPLTEDLLSAQTTTNPSVEAGSVTTGSVQTTGDTTDLAALYTTLGVSILGLIVVIKKSKEKTE
ncbi:MAG: toxin Cry1Ac domain D-VI-related protein [Coprobacillaceae bacterium]